MATAHPTRHPYPTIGVLAGWQYYWTATPRSYLDPIYRGIRAAARRLRCNLLLGCGLGTSATPSDPARPAWPVVMDGADFVPIGPWNTDGLVVINPLHAESRSRYVRELIEARHPVIFVGSGEQGPTIVADNANGITAALRHLVEHGHRRIAFIAGSPEDIEGDTGARLRAYRSAVAAYGLANDEGLVAFGRHVFAAGYTAMHTILASGKPFSAVLASNDESAHGAIQALQEAGRRVPDDVAIIGFDDRPESAVLKPALTSVQNPLFKLGYQALEQLLRQLAGQAAPAQPIQVPVRLVVRESCGCGHSAVIADTLELSPRRSPADEGKPLQSRLVQKIARAMLSATQGLGFDEVERLCQGLVETFLRGLERRDPAEFRRDLEPILGRVAAGGDDAHLWQAAISLLREEVPYLPATQQSIPADLAYSLLDEARVMISAATHQQHRQYVVDQRWTVNRLGLLTAQLSTALDEAEIDAILARYLGEMKIQIAWVGLFEADADDPVAWSELRDATAPLREPLRSRSRDFPPSGWLSDDRPFSLALLPLIGSRGRTGFVAFEAVHLDQLGAIAQQMSAALNTAQLYREATEGRRLAEEANQLKSRFLSTVSHELRTPLHLIVGMSDLLLQESRARDLQLPAPILQGVERIRSNARHLGRLISDVLDLASSDAGQLHLACEYVDLGQALQQAAEIGQQMAQEKSLMWHASLPTTGPWVWGDRTRLHQVALNLLSNAVKFTAQGEICLSVETGADSVTVRVRDTGLGLPVAEQQAIFEEFRRSERSVLRGYGGIGLGLAICQRLIAMHGGSIDVESSGVEGAGSEFRFTLPTVQPPSPSPQPGPGEGQSRQQVLVLSSHAGGEGLRSHLQRRGFAVRTIPIEESAAWLSQLLLEPHAAIVLDISQPAAQGWHALRLLKSNPATQQIPTLFYAAEAASGGVLELDYLTKPIGVGDLTRALDHYRQADDEADADNPHTYLVVDDDPDTLNLHSRIIQSQNRPSRIVTARNGVEALQALQETRVDLVLLDLMMPEMDGFSVLEAMRRDNKQRNVPVIVVTGQTLTSAEMERLNLGVTQVLGKGLFSVEETLSHLDAALARTRGLSHTAQRLVRQAMAYLQAHYAEPISRQQLADHVGLSHDYLTSCFHKELGLTPVAYLQRIRIQQAKQLLRETRKSVTEIALEVGFSNSSYFSRIFRRETGQTPAAFRRA